MWARSFRLLAIAVALLFIGCSVGNNYRPPEAVAPPSPRTSGFLVENLSILPEEIQPKELVTITVSVTNTHDTWGIYSLVLKINGIKEVEKQVFVDAGSTKNATFSVSSEVPGSYRVSINDLIGSFTVEKPPEEKVREVEVIKEVEVVREVQIVKEVPMQLQYFGSVEEMEDWLCQIDGPIVLKCNSNGVIQLTGVCEDVAMYLQDRAIEDGYRISIELLGRDQYRKWYGSWINYGDLHAVNSAIIGNEVWFIDLLEDKVWLAAYLDEPE